MRKAPIDYEECKDFGVALNDSNFSGNSYRPVAILMPIVDSRPKSEDEFSFGEDPESAGRFKKSHLMKSQSLQMPERDKLKKLSGAKIR